MFVENNKIYKIIYMQLYSKSLLTLLLFCTYFLTSCRENPANNKYRDNNITIGAVLSTSNVINFNKVNHFGDLLNSEFPNLRFTGDEISNYAEAIEKICQHKWDLSFAFSPIVASEALKCDHTALHPAFVYENKSLDKNTYFVGFIAHKNSDIDSLDDIEGRSLALKQRHSASGFYIPLSELYGKTLAKVGFLGTENEVARNVLNGNYDVGVTAMNNGSVMAFGKMNQNLKLIGQSQPIPGGALLVSNRLKAKLGTQDYNSFLEVLEQESVYKKALKINTKDGDAFLYHPKYPVPDYKDFFESKINKVKSIGDCYLETPAKIYNCREKTHDNENSN